MLIPLDLEKKKVLASRRSVFLLNETLIIAYNTSQPYPQQISSNPDFLSLRRLHLPSYESNNAPYLCAAPAIPEYTGALLGRLKQTEFHFPIVEKHGKFRLDPLLAKSWLSLEKALNHIGIILVFSAQPYFSLDYRFPPAPSEFGFLREFNSRHDAMVATQKSRNAFQILIAHCAWGAMLHRARAMRYDLAKEKNTSDGFQPTLEMLKAWDAGWKSILRDKHNIRPAWLDALIQSSIFDFSIRRAGLVVRKPEDWIYADMVPFLVMSNVPVWLIWGEPKVSPVSISWPVPMKESYGPNYYERQYAHVWTGCPETGNCRILPSTPAVLYSDDKDRRVGEVDDGLKPTSDISLSDNPDSRVRVASVDEPGIFEWICKRKEDIKLAKAKATPEQLHRYLQRQQTADSYECPGRRGATVFEWEANEAGHLMRRLVNRASVPQVWSLYGNKQRWYNCVRNEWELCQELDPTDTPCDLDSEYNDGVVGYECTLINDTVHVCHSDSQSMPIWNERPSHIVDCDVNACLINFQTDGSSSFIGEFTTTIGRDILLFLSQRFGFAYDRTVTYLPSSKAQWSLAKTMSIVGDSKSERTLRLPEGLEASAIQFLMHLATIGHPDASVTDIPPALCDLYQENKSYLAQIQSFVSIQTVNAGGMPLYLLRHSQDDDREWILAVADPCVALSAIRSDPPTITDFAIGLIRARTPFLTLRRSTSQNLMGTSRPVSKHKQRRLGLGERPPGHKLDKFDYIVYEAERVRLLKNPRIARAAVKHGGILSRLVYDLIDECDILNGPSSSALEYPFNVTTTFNGEEVTFYDDSLSDEEISLLVGLYSIKPGTCSEAFCYFAIPILLSVPDTSATPAEQSWWPTVGKFTESGLNIGVWTPKCKEWYLRRRAGILAETHGACTAAKWRNHLRFDMDTKKVYKGAKDLAARYIAQNYYN